MVKHLPMMQETRVRFLGGENRLEKEMATHSSTLAWKIPWTEEPGRLQSMRSLRVGHDWATSFDFSLSCIGEGNGNPLQYSCLENPRDRGAWWAAVSGVAQSRTQLKRLSSSSSSANKLGSCIRSYFVTTTFQNFVGPQWLFERIFKLLLPGYEKNCVNIKINISSTPRLIS